MANPKNESQVMARLRHELLTALYVSLPVPLTKDQLLVKCETPFLCRDKDWYHQAVADQLKVLATADLVRNLYGGFTLTEKGKRDRQQAARFFNNAPPPEAA